MTSLFAAFFILAFSALLAALPWRKEGIAARCGSGGAILAALAALAGAAQVLAGGEEASFYLPLSLPGAAISLRLDGLAAFFLLPLFAIGLCGAVYGREYMRSGAKSRWPGLHWTCYNLLLLSMALVLTAANGILFLFAWECMSLSSFALVISEHK